MEQARKLQTLSQIPHRFIGSIHCWCRLRWWQIIVNLLFSNGMFTLRLFAITLIHVHKPWNSTLDGHWPQTMELNLLALSICVLHQSLCNQFVCSCPRRRCCCCDGSIIESKVCHNACCVCGFTKLLENYLSSIKFSWTNIKASLFALLQAL